jgi:hypothetical protein
MALWIKREPSDVLRNSSCRSDPAAILRRIWNSRVCGDGPARNLAAQIATFGERSKTIMRGTIHSREYLA